MRKVFVDTSAFVALGRPEAIEWGRRFRASEAIEQIRVDEPVEEEAWSMLESHADKTCSYVDATPFALMEREGSAEAFAFDRHFAQRGLTLLPGTRR